jgi:hypothetical protein
MMPATMGTQIRRLRSGADCIYSLKTEAGKRPNQNRQTESIEIYITFRLHLTGATLDSGARSTCPNDAQASRVNEHNLKLRFLQRRKQVLSN